MGRLTKSVLLAWAAAMLVSQTVSAGETATYKGMGTYEVMRAVLPLANGGAAIHLSHNGPDSARVQARSNSGVPTSSQKSVTTARP